MPYSLSMTHDFFHGPEGFEGPHFDKKWRPVSLYGAIQALPDEDWVELTELWELDADTASPEELVDLVKEQVDTADNLDSPMRVWLDPRRELTPVQVYDGEAVHTIDQLMAERGGYNRNPTKTIDLSSKPNAFFMGPRNSFHGKHFDKTGRPVSLWGALVLIPDHDLGDLDKLWAAELDDEIEASDLLQFAKRVNKGDALKGATRVWLDPQGEFKVIVYDGSAVFGTDSKVFRQIQNLDDDEPVSNLIRKQK